MAADRLPEDVEREVRRAHVRPCTCSVGYDKDCNEQRGFLRRAILAAMYEAKADGMMGITSTPMANARDLYARAAAIREGK